MNELTRRDALQLAALGAAAAVHLPFPLLLPWLALVGAATGFYPAVLNEIRRTVPPGTIVYLSTLLTAGTMLVVFLVQLGTGFLADLFPGTPGHHPEAVYRAIFALLAALMGLDAALSLATLIVATATTPLTVPLLASVFAGAALDISPFWLGVKLIAMLGGTALAAFTIRKVMGAPWVSRHSGPIDGLSVIALFVFAIGLMDGIGANILARPALVAGLTVFVYGLTIVLIVLTCLIFHRAGRSPALALGLAVGSRNMGLMVAATGGAVPELTWLYFAVAQFPIYTLPYALKPLIHRWIAADGLPARTGGVRGTAED